jgi:uncharacterized protein (DUF1697 family)
MPRYFALLRAINVGGRHTVRMDSLRRLFESLGFAKVETFIASGNVLFETASKNAQALERKIEAALREALGYDVATFIRTDAELTAVATYEPFSRSDLAEAAALNIAFLADGPDDEAGQKLLALRSEVDDFRLHGREVYWLCRKRQSESKMSNAVLEKALGQKSTMRGANTIKKMVAKYS